MKKIVFVSILLLLNFLLASNGPAQQQQQSQQSRQMRSQQSPQAEPEQGQQSSQSGQQLQWAQKSSDILDKKVISKDGKELGTAEDLVIGKDGKIEFVILSTGGLLGIGGEKVAVPWDKVKATPNVDQLRAEVTQSEVQKYSGGEKESGDSQKTAQGGQQESPVPLAQVDPERAKGYMDQKVTGKNGEELGRVKDLFTSEDGRPLYVIVQGETEQLHPVPAQLVRTKPGDKSLSADLDKQAFQSSPGFDEAQISSQQWEPTVRGYYQRGFQSGQSGRQPPPTGMGQGRQQPPPGKGGLQNQ